MDTTQHELSMIRTLKTEISPLRTCPLPEFALSRSNVAMRVGMILGFGDPFVLQATAALVERDKRFRLCRQSVGEHTESTQRSAGNLALVDGRQPPRGLESLLLSNHVVAGVVLTGSSSPELSFPSPIQRREVVWGSPWSVIASCLLETANAAGLGSHGGAAASLEKWQDDRQVLGLLTSREHDVLRLIAEGCSVRQVAAALHLAESTIDNHKSRLMKKVGVKKSVDLARFAFRTGVATP